LAAGETRIDIGVAYSNIFERSDTPTHFQLFDLERLSTTVVVRRNLTSRFEAGARLTVHTSWTGFLDGLIQGVHDAFNTSNGDRAFVETGGYDLVLRQRNGEALLDIAKRGFAPADLHLFGRALLYGGPSESSTVSVQGTVKIPTGVEGTNTGRADVALEVLGRQGGGPWALHWMLGATTLSPPVPLEPLANDAAVLFGAGVERVLGSGLSLIAQAQSSSRYVSGIGEDELDDFPLIIGFGVAGSTTHWGWQAGFVEDIPPNGPSADITLHVQFSRIWE
jgi:hypothetical protein